MPTWEFGVIWGENSSFDYDSYNRFINNLKVLETKYPGAALTDMTPIQSYTHFYSPDDFNVIEENIMKIINTPKGQAVALHGSLSYDRQRYFPGGPFITWRHLNEIENVMLTLYLNA